MIARGIAVALLALAVPAAAQTLGASDSAANESMAVPKGAKLVWSDEFNRPGAPDPAKWRFDDSANRHGWPNGEAEYYAAHRPENVRVAGGRLIIEARHERLADRPDFGGQDYSSGRIDTRGLAQWTYGFVEVRAKLACGKGLWPAIWLLGADPTRHWPGNGEIDVMEEVGWDPTTIHATIHTQAYNHVAHTQRGAATTVGDACDRFHTYQLDWTPDRVLIGVDGHGYMRFANDHAGNPDTWPFGKPHYLILNVAVGGWGGQQGIDNAAFPSRMEVDYVRVWQRPPSP